MGLAQLAGFTEGLGSRIKEDREKMYAEIKDAASFYRQAGMKRLEERRGKKDKLTERFNTVKTLVGDSEYASNIADSAIRLSDSAFDDFMSTLKTNIDSIGQMEEFTQYTETQEPSEFMDDAGDTVPIPMVTSSTGKRTVDMDSVIGRYVSKDAKPTDVTVDNAVNSVLGTFKNTGIADNNPSATRLGDSFRGFFGTLTAEQKARKAYQKAGSLLGKSGDELEALLSSDGMEYKPTSTEGIALGIADPVRARAQRVDVANEELLAYNAELVTFNSFDGTEKTVRRDDLQNALSLDKQESLNKGTKLDPTNITRVTKNLTRVMEDIVPNAFTVGKTPDGTNIVVFKNAAELDGIGKLAKRVSAAVAIFASDQYVKAGEEGKYITNYGSLDWVRSHIATNPALQRELNIIYADTKAGDFTAADVTAFKKKLIGNVPASVTNSVGTAPPVDDTGDEAAAAEAEAAAAAADAAADAAAEARATRITQANKTIDEVYTEQANMASPSSLFQQNNALASDLKIIKMIRETFGVERSVAREALSKYYKLNNDADRKRETVPRLTGELLQSLIGSETPQAVAAAVPQAAAPQAAAEQQVAIDSQQIFNKVNGRPREYIVRMIGNSPLYPLASFPLANNARKNLIDKIVKELGDKGSSPATIDAATKTVLNR